MAYTNRVDLTSPDESGHTNQNCFYLLLKTYLKVLKQNYSHHLIGGNSYTCNLSLGNRGGSGMGFFRDPKSRDKDPGILGFLSQKIPNLKIPKSRDFLGLGSIFLGYPGIF